MLLTNHQMYQTNIIMRKILSIMIINRKLILLVNIMWLVVKLLRKTIEKCHFLSSNKHKTHFRRRIHYMIRKQRKEIDLQYLMLWVETPSNWDQRRSRLMGSLQGIQPVYSHQSIASKRTTVAPPTLSNILSKSPNWRGTSSQKICCMKLAHHSRTRPRVKHAFPASLKEIARNNICGPYRRSLAIQCVIHIPNWNSRSIRARNKPSKFKKMQCRRIPLINLSLCLPIRAISIRETWKDLKFRKNKSILIHKFWCKAAQVRKNERRVYQFSRTFMKNRWEI